MHICVCVCVCVRASVCMGVCVMLLLMAWMKVVLDNFRKDFVGSQYRNFE